MLRKMCRYYRKNAQFIEQKKMSILKKVKCLCGPNKSLLNITSPCLMVYFCGLYNKNRDIQSRIYVVSLKQQNFKFIGTLTQPYKFHFLESYVKN